jgi:hypothetical protein
MEGEGFTNAAHRTIQSFQEYQHAIVHAIQENIRQSDSVPLNRVKQYSYQSSTPNLFLDPIKSVQSVL